MRDGRAGQVLGRAEVDPGGRCGEEGLMLLLLCCCGRRQEEGALAFAREVHCRNPQIVAAPRHAASMHMHHHTSLETKVVGKVQVYGKHSICAPNTEYRNTLTGTRTTYLANEANEIHASMVNQRH